MILYFSVRIWVLEILDVVVREEHIHPFCMGEILELTESNHLHDLRNFCFLVRGSQIWWLWGLVCLTSWRKGRKARCLNRLWTERTTNLLFFLSQNLFHSQTLIFSALPSRLGATCCHSECCYFCPEC